MSNVQNTNVLSQEFLQSLVDFKACNERVKRKLASIKSKEELLRFFCQYASWNGQFANGVAALVSMVGDKRSLFMEQGLPRAVADRSNFIASHFFDAARDEYDDHINEERDSHRCMAQASLLGMSEVLGLGTGILDEGDPASIAAVYDNVLKGYTGQPMVRKGAIEQVFFGMGYHLGSELLADREFSLIDEYLRAEHAEFVQALMRKTVELAGATHRCYAWIGVHSGHGGGVEADHFDVAVKGVHEGLRYIDPEQRERAMKGIKEGFLAFAADHEEFFSIKVG